MRALFPCGCFKTMVFLLVVFAASSLVFSCGGDGSGVETIIDDSGVSDGPRGGGSGPKDDGNPDGDIAGGESGPVGGGSTTPGGGAGPAGDGSGPAVAGDGDGPAVAGGGGTETGGGSDSEPLTPDMFAGLPDVYTVYSEVSSAPHGIVTVDDHIYVIDGTDRSINELVFDEPPDAVLDLVAGGIHGYMDTPDGVARFGHSFGLTKLDGVIYVADTQNTSIRRVDIGSDGSAVVDTVAGAKPVQGGYKDGVGLAARFKLPYGIVAGDGVLFVADTYNQVIRQLDVSNFSVTTVAGTLGVEGYGDFDSEDGLTKFDMPCALAVDEEYLYIADNHNNRIRRMNLVDHKVDTLAGDGTVATVDGVGEAASFDSPRALDYYGGYLYVTEGIKLPGVTGEGGGQVLRKVNASTGEVTTIAGQVGVKATVDGSFFDASFNDPLGVKYVPNIGIFVSDSGSGSVRLVKYQSEEDTSGYCGDEAYYAGEAQEKVAVVKDSYVDDEAKHQLLPPIELKVSGIDANTVSKDAIRVMKNGEPFDDYVLAAGVDGGAAKIALGNGASGKRAWAPASSYSVKLCHQIKTVGGVPIEPTEIVVTTRIANKNENIGMSHSNGTRSGVFYLPKGYDPEKKYPLALVLHGLGGDGAGMVSEFKALADSKGMILLGPDGFSRVNPFGSGNTYYFNPNHVGAEVPDYTFAIAALKKIKDAFSIEESKMMVAGMSMGAPATLFFSGHEGYFTHGAMLHGVRWNYDPSKANDVANLLWFPWEATPLGTFRPLFWYSTSVDDWVTNYDKMPGFGLTVNDDLAYVENAGYNVTHKFDYPGGHWMTDQEKLDLVNWFLGN